LVRGEPVLEVHRQKTRLQLRLQPYPTPSSALLPQRESMNWLDEAARFALTLRPQRFWPGDRPRMLDEAGPFHLIVCSYGLLQTESERLTGVTWSTSSPTRPRRSRTP